MIYKAKSTGKAPLTRKSPLSGTCIECGDDFLCKGKGKPQKYCSHACNWKAWAKRHHVVRLQPGDTVTDRHGVVVVDISEKGVVLIGRDRILAKEGKAIAE